MISHSRCAIFKLSINDECSLRNFKNKIEFNSNLIQQQKAD